MLEKSYTADEIVGVATSRVMIKDLPTWSSWTFRENHSPNIIYTVNRRNQPTAMDLCFLDWVRTRYNTEPETRTQNQPTRYYDQADASYELGPRGQLG